MVQQPPLQKPDLEQELEKKMQSLALGSKAQDAQNLAKKLNLPFSDLKGAPIDPEVMNILPEDTSRSAQVAIIAKSGSTLILAVLDPKSSRVKEIITDLESKSFTVKILISTITALENAWKRYATIKTAEIFEVGAIDIKEEELDKLQAQIKDIGDLKNQLKSVSATKLLEILVAGALKTNASDIHFEPEKEQVRLRYRLDGLLNDVARLDTGVYTKALNRIKVLSKLKLNIHKAPQDGRFTIRQKNIAIEVRVSILPSEYGESIVTRLLDPRAIRSKLEDLGMRDDILAQVKEQLQKPNGTLMTTGPTGSGKTTTLYAFVNYLNTPDMKIITVEDPIEYHIAGISQTQVDPSKGYTFASGLRSIVRQDPDIILIGEIRDEETAGIALNAALTGHMVLSTIHTNDAAGTIPRLIDIGAKAETIAPALTMAMGQRLLRRLCNNCKKENTLTSQEISAIKPAVDPIRERFKLPSVDEKLKVYVPGKCKECNDLGYKGRIGVYEVFAVTKEMEKLILGSPAISDVRDLAVSQGMVTMIQDGYIKLIQGITSLEEIRRILG